MQRVNPFGSGYGDIVLPDNTFVAHMEDPALVDDPKSAIEDSLIHPIASESLEVIARRKKEAKKDAKAVIVISDNTRPVPYKGDDGILLPVIETLIRCGYAPSEITALVATGMHRPMREDELHAMINEKVFELGVKVVNHEPRNPERLVYIGTTKRGTNVMIDTLYAEADLKIATGLVESHFMAGVSGGRKAICPGVIGEETTYIFHGPALMDDPDSRDLSIDNNPVHDESLAVAKLAGVDFIVNVTLDHSFRITGVYSGDLEKAHLAAAAKIRESVGVPVPYEADVVITHAGFVGINHYQCAKCGVASLGALRKDGYLVTIADCTDKGHVIGSPNYRTTLALLHLVGSDAFVRILNSPDWVFLPEQWQVQEWAKVFRKIPQDHYYFYAPQITHDYFDLLPGNDIRMLMDGADEKSADIYAKAIDSALSDIERKTGKKRSELRIIYIADGPYEIPYTEGGRK